MPSLKVGLHEWIVVDLKNNPIELWTSGLSGCVGVAIITPTYAFVTHISSGITPQQWENTVKEEFLAAIKNMTDINAATECMVVGGQNPDLYTAILESVDDIMNEKTKDRLVVTPAEGKSGVKVCLEGNKYRTRVISNLNDDPRGGILNSNTGQAYCKAKGFFPCAAGSIADVG